MKKNLTHSYVCCVALLSLSAAEAAPWDFPWREDDNDGILKCQFSPDSGTMRVIPTFGQTRGRFLLSGRVTSLTTVAELRFQTIEPMKLTFSSDKLTLPDGSAVDQRSLAGHLSLREEVQESLQALSVVEREFPNLTVSQKLSVSYAIHVMPNDSSDNDFVFVLDSESRPERPKRVTFLSLSSHVRVTIAGQELQDQDRIELGVSSSSDRFPLTISLVPEAIAQGHAWREMQNQGFDASFAFATVLTFPEDIEVLVNVFIPHHEGFPLDLGLSKRICDYALRPFLVRPSIAFDPVLSVEVAEIHEFAVNNEIATMQALFYRASGLASVAISPRIFFEVVSYGSCDMLKLLLKHGVDANARPNGERLMPLQVATRLQEPMKIKLLQEHGAHAPNEDDDSGRVSDDSPPAFPFDQPAIMPVICEEEEEEEEEPEPPVVLTVIQEEEEEEEEPEPPVVLTVIQEEEEEEEEEEEPEPPVVLTVIQEEEEEAEEE
ncbi:MAG: hypothetical protein LBD40_00310 [Puniceicoccales bacterium]|jgi:hypothetical protein|nr:hypothetical protein [Puniceicoccales bacterium]